MRCLLLPALLLPLLPFAASAAASGGTASAPLPPAEAKVVYGARLYLPGFAISPRSYSKSWTASGSVGTGEATGTGTEADPFVLPFSLNVGSGSSAATLSGTGRFHVAPGGEVAADWTAVADRDGSMAEAFVGVTIQASDMAGGSIHLDGKPLAIPREKSKTGRLAERRVSRVAAIAQDGRTILDVAFDAPTDVLVQDDRFYGYADIALRFFFATGRVEKGREYAVRGSFAVPTSAPLSLTVGKPVKIVAGEDWIPFRYDPWIEPGSAIDFTGVVPHHEPAGKFGRVLAVGDHFEFEGLPGESQRFYGANVCGEANLPRTAEEADRFAANLARIGYNALRLHHHERWLVRKDGKLPKDGALGDRALPVGADLRAARFDSTALDPAQMDRFDLLVAACVRHGIYLTTDLYVSRAHVIPWRELGIDRDGPVPADRYKLLCAFYEPAYSNLCAWSRNFLTHVNPYTGRSLAEEPALATLALINEGNLGNKGVDALRETPGVQEAWTAWLAEHPDIARETTAKQTEAAGGNTKADHPAAAGETGGIAAGPHAAFPASLYATDGSTPANRLAAAFAIFLADREAALFARLRDFVRNELGCQAPLSSLSAWYDPAQYSLARREFDYVDYHFYVDHPQFLDIPWRLPSSCPNANPILRPAAGAAGVLYTRQMDKPLCITEFNYSGPGRYRGVGGIAAGALGALQDWSGLWRFAWSHSIWGIVSPGGQMGYFDVSGDPLAIAAERAALCLFLRRDLAPLAAEEPVVFSETKLRDPRNGAPQVSAIGDPDRAWQARLGVRFDPPASAAPPTATQAHQHRSFANQSVAISPDGTFLIDSPLTAGGLAEGGAHTAGPLTFELQETHRNGDSSSPDGGIVAPATVWVSSLDGEPIATSRHLLLTHLTDVQNTGIEYADEDRTILLKWGALPHLMRNGAAQIELALAYDSDALPPTVWRLDSAGRRVAEIPVVFDPGTGRLSFTARTDYDPASATYLYEIVRQ